MKKTIVLAAVILSITACQKKEQVTQETTQVSDTTKVVGTETPATTTTPATGSVQDQEFVKKASIGGLFEVELGEYAQANGTHAKVKELSQHIITDHKKANDELKAIATKEGLVPATALDAEKEAKVKELKAKKGAEFDKAYAELMVSDHKADIAEFKKEAAEGQNAALKAFAQKTLPALEHHLTMAEEAQKAVK